ncbi:hypothetical protein FACS189490_04180 [Clostridia bacterium]|nr:hypothetical protein FACS189490_04180 [Clostridia bacterium]
MDENEKGFIVAAEYAYEDEGGKRRIVVVEFPASKETLQALTDKIGESGYYRDGSFPHYAEGKIPGLDEVLNEMDGDVSPEELNDLAVSIDKLDDLSQVILRDAVDWRRDNDTENLNFVVDALSDVTRRGTELAEARAEIAKLREPRTIKGYTVLQSVKIAGQEIIAGENMDADYGKRYMLWHRSMNFDFGQEKHFVPVYDAEYLTVMRHFSRYVSAGLDNLDLDRIYRGNRLTDPMLTAEWCVPGGMNKDCNGKVIAIKPEIFSPEYRAESHQLFLAIGGFGCSPTARGRSVYVTNLYDREELVFNRSDVLGVMDEAKLPDWAKENLAAIRKEAAHGAGRETPTQPSPEPPEDRGATGRKSTVSQAAPPQFESVLAKIDEGKERQKQQKAQRRQEKQEEHGIVNDQKPLNKRRNKHKDESEL